MSYTDDIQERLESCRKIREHYQLACVSLLGGYADRGPLSETLNDLLEIVQGAILVAPFKAGDRVQLLKAPVMEKGHGWYGAKHFLIVGAVGNVHSIQLRKTGWMVYVTFVLDSWIGLNGVINHSTDPWLYGFNAKDFQKVLEAPLPVPCTHGTCAL